MGQYELGGGNVNVVTGQPNGSATGIITASGQSVTLSLPAGTSGTGFQFTGTFAGTVTFESSQDGGTTYNARVYRSAGVLNNLQTSTTTFPSEWRGNSAHMTHVRVRCTSYTSGTLNVRISSSEGAGAVFLNAAVPIGGQSTGNVYNAALTAGATYTGTYENLENVASILISVSINQTGTLTIQYSQDGSSLFVTDSAIALASGVGRYIIRRPRAQYMRVLLTNTSGSTASQARLEVVYRATATDGPAVELGMNADINDTMVSTVSSAVAHGKNAANTYVPIKVDAIGKPLVTEDNSAATLAALVNKYGGGKTAVVATVTASGDTTIHTPAVGKKIRLYWIQAINDPDEASTPLIKVKIGATELYRGYALSHWEVFIGATNAALVVNLDAISSVAVTAHLEEIT